MAQHLRSGIYFLSKDSVSQGSVESGLVCTMSHARAHLHPSSRLPFVSFSKGPRPPPG